MAERLRFKVEGMDCASCARTIERGLARVEGVSDISISTTDRRVDLVLDDDPAVVDAVMMAGFSARLADWTPRDDVLNDAQEREGRT